MSDERMPPRIRADFNLSVSDHNLRGMVIGNDTHNRLRLPNRDALSCLILGLQALEGMLDQEVTRLSSDHHLTGHMGELRIETHGEKLYLRGTLEHPRD